MITIFSTSKWRYLAKVFYVMYKLNYKFKQFEGLHYLTTKYRIRRCLIPLNDLHFPKFVREGLDNGDFFFNLQKFSKILQLLYKKCNWRIVL